MYITYSKSVCKEKVTIKSPPAKIFEQIKINTQLSGHVYVTKGGGFGVSKNVTTHSKIRVLGVW